MNLISRPLLGKTYPAANPADLSLYKKEWKTATWRNSHLLENNHDFVQARTALRAGSAYVPPIRAPRFTKDSKWFSPKQTQWVTDGCCAVVGEAPKGATMSEIVRTNLDMDLMIVRTNEVETQMLMTCWAGEMYQDLEVVVADTGQAFAKAYIDLILALHPTAVFRATEPLKPLSAYVEGELVATVLPVNINGDWMK